MKPGRLWGVALDRTSAEREVFVRASTADIADRIANFVVEHLKYDGKLTDLLADPPVPLTQATDSMGLLELASHVEDEFGIVIADEDISRTNFGSVADVVRLIVSKTASPAASTPGATK